MLLLTSVNDTASVQAGTAADLEVHASYIDHNAGTFTPGRTNTASIGGTGETTVVAAPAASTQRNVKHLNIKNNHASQSTLVTVRHTDGTNIEVLFSVTLLAGEALVFTQGGVWLHYDVNGGTYPQVGAIASQAEMEAAVSLVTVVPPGRLHNHPGVAKFWAQVTGGGTPALTTNYNVTSIADTAVGRMTITIATDFSSAGWCCSATTFTTATTGDEGISNINAKAAGTVEIGNRIITPAFADPNIGYDVSGFGDQ